MNLLAFDTATEACSAALTTPEGVFARWAEAPRQHGDLVLAMVDEVLAEAGLERGQLDTLAFGRGPGAFTGVRIATGLVQGMAAALECPVVPVSTLATLAQGAYRRTGCSGVLAAIDARMGEVYWGAYTLAADGVVAAHGEECVVAPEAVPLPGPGPWACAGTGWIRYPDTLAARVGAGTDSGHTLPDARDMLTIATRDGHAGRTVSAAEALPVYLRDQVTGRPKPG